MFGRKVSNSNDLHTKRVRFFVGSERPASTALCLGTMRTLQHTFQRAGTLGDLTRGTHNVLPKDSGSPCHKCGAFMRNVVNAKHLCKGVSELQMTMYNAYGPSDTNLYMF